MLQIQREKTRNHVANTKWKKKLENMLQIPSEKKLENMLQIPSEKKN